MERIVRLDSIDAYNKLYGLPTLHPLAAVVDLAQATRPVSDLTMNYGIYALFLKQGTGCTLKYGRRNYDYQEGTIVSFAPGQVVGVEHDFDRKNLRPDVSGLLFHPDLIHGTSLGQKIARYEFFSYAQNEALHLSEQERGIIIDCMKKIALELEHPVDSHSRKLLCVGIELLLEYCMRFYDRQFCTREKVNNDVLQQFERHIDEYFNSNAPQQYGLPTVKYFADKVFLTPGYFGDLVRKQTGRTAQEYIRDRTIDRSKQLLLGSAQSVSEIAYALGFQYPQHFSRLFKRQTGCTPNEFRSGGNA